MEEISRSTTKLLPTVCYQDEGFTPSATSIRDQLEKGIIEAVSADEPSLGTVHYLQHHAIV